MRVPVAAKKILIVEDDADIRQLINLRLRARNYDTAFATDAITAMSIARKEEPDLIVLDLGLPGGDGFLIMERLKAFASLSTVPVIVVTARDPATSRERALSAGAHAFLQKPIDMAELTSAIDAAIGPVVES
jgi:DNA-binding response OmpR family regulator